MYNCEAHFPHKHLDKSNINQKCRKACLANNLSQPLKQNSLQGEKQIAKGSWRPLLFNNHPSKPPYKTDFLKKSSWEHSYVLVRSHLLQEAPVLIFNNDKWNYRKLLFTRETTTLSETLFTASREKGAANENGSFKNVIKYFKGVIKSGFWPLFVITITMKTLVSLHYNLLLSNLF